jgi:hypothetical protein
MISKLVADLRNKLTPFTNLAYLVDDAKDLNAVGNLLYRESKKCKDLTPIVKKLLQDILDQETKKEESFFYEVAHITKNPPYTVKAVRNKFFFGYNYQISFEDGILFNNLSADNANTICDALNGAYLLGFSSSKNN